MPTPVRYTAGVTQNAPWQVLGNSGFDDPHFYHVFATDFDTVNAADYIVTDTGTPTNALSAVDGGVLLNTTSAGATDATFLQLKTASFAFVPATNSVAGKKSFFRTRVALSDATNSAFYAGLMGTTTTPLTAQDGLYFLKASGATSFILRSSIGGVNTDLAMTGFAFANATYLDLGWYFDGKTTVYAFVSVPVGFQPQSGTGSTVTVKGPAFSFTPSLTTAVLAPSFGIQNGAAAAKTLSVDHILVARER